MKNDKNIEIWAHVDELIKMEQSRVIRKTSISSLDQLCVKDQDSKVRITKENVVTLPKAPIKFRKD